MTTKDLEAKLCLHCDVPSKYNRKNLPALKGLCIHKEKGMDGFKQQYLRVRLHMI
jgi:hypothetical protein